MEVELKKGEVIEDLQLNGLKIIQNKLDYCFSSDSVMLSDFSQVKHKDRVVEFCSGSGVVSILIKEKYKPKEIIGFEIQKELCDMSNRSVELNDLKDIKFLNEDLKNSKNYFGTNHVDVVVCNPPYYKKIDSQKDMINIKNRITKFETLVILDEVIESASKVLKESGKLFLVHLSSRLQEIMVSAEKHSLICKKIKFVFPQDKNTSKLALMMFTKGGKEGTEVLK